VEKVKEIYRVGENERNYDGGIVVKKICKNKLEPKQYWRICGGLKPI
jgi:hypothetical protein